MITLAEVLTLLSFKGPMGTAELMHAFPSLARRNLGAKLARLLKTPRRIHIAAWARNPGPGSSIIYLRPLYGVGDHPDAAKPPALTHAEREARRRVLQKNKPRKNRAKPKPVGKPTDKPLHSTRGLSPQAVSARVPNSVWALNKPT
jgi:hypothetical protein